MTTTYLSVDEVARKYNVNRGVLIQLIEAGMIETHETPSGELLVVADKNGSNGQKFQTKEEIIEEEFAHLRGETISASEASRRYSKDEVKIYPSRFSDWAKAGYISSEFDGYRLLRAVQF